MRSGHDYVLIGRRAALDLPFLRLLDELERSLRRVHAERAGAKRRGGQGALPTPNAGSAAG
jgi:ribonuclease P protein component